MNSEIDDRAASILLEEICKKLNIKLTADESLRLIYDVLTPHLQNQFNEGVEALMNDINSNYNLKFKRK